MVRETYLGGIKAHPTDAEVAAAIQFGIASKNDENAVRSAYLSRVKTSAATTEPFNIVVRTPLYLISRHAMAEARAGREVDPKFVAYARELGLVKLAVSRRDITSATWRAYALTRELTLVRDGVPVKPVASIPSWNQLDPFFNTDDPLGSWQSSSWLKRGVEDMQMNSLRQTQELAGQRTGPNGENGRPKTSVGLQPGDGVFPAEELRKPGRYELIFRAPHGGISDGKPISEVRIPIRFDRFR